MDDIRERDLSRKSNEDLTDEEKRELARRFQEFSDLVREKGPQSLGLQSKPRKKRISKWDPAAMASAGKKADSR
ncbi:hypothetical protein [Ferruginivarius sediminum]|uniref:Uncharacterized protein n=1 Tax=Ferruginivarius sediminum TaxID=2661937 RepID=A0A369TB18_9PROT|nr:hypothetical protein [Ferruginivarius sediminum]RDD62531.1 hypothetical protein DRB17_07755 [Ferruginivarius sediminum]